MSPARPHYAMALAARTMDCDFAGGSTMAFSSSALAATWILMPFGCLHIFDFVFAQVESGDGGSPFGSPVAHALLAFFMLFDFFSRRHELKFARPAKSRVKRRKLPHARRSADTRLPRSPTKYTPLPASLITLPR